MSEGNWNIETDPDAVWLIKSVLRDVAAKEDALTEEMIALKKQLMDMDCRCCDGVTEAEDEVRKCHDRISEIQYLLRKLAEKREFFEQQRRMYEKQVSDDELG